MPEYLSPGVYVEEVDAGPKPIEGVSTSTAGAVGVTARGPDTGKPLLVTSFAEYMRKFGGAITVDGAVKAVWSDDPEKGEFWTFPLAVKGFFDNGGQRLYVRRVVSQDSAPAESELGKGLMTFIAANALDQATTLKLDSLIGIAKGTTMNVFADGTALSVTVSDYNTTASTITFSPPLTNRVQAGRDFVEIKAVTGKSIKVTAKSRGEWGNVLSVRVRPMDAGSFALLAAPGEKAASTAIDGDVAGDNVIKVQSTTDFQNGDAILVDGKPYTLKSVAAATKKLTIDLGLPAFKKDWVVKKAAAQTKIVADIAAAPFDKFDVVDAIAPAFAVNDVIDVNGEAFKITAIDPTTPPATPGADSRTLTVKRVQAWKNGWSVMRVRTAGTVSTTTPTLYVWGASSLYKNAFVEVEDAVGKLKYYGTVSAVAGNKVDLTFAAAPASFTVAEGQRVRLIEGVFDVLYAPKDGPAVTEEIRNVRFKEAEVGDVMYVERRIGAVSTLITVVTPPSISIGSLDDFPLAVDNTAGTPPVAQKWMKLLGGKDEFGALDPDAFVGVDLGPGKRSGIQALEDIDDISITIAPSIWSSLVQNALVQQAETLKYRFAILDPRPVKPNDDDVIGKIRAFREGFDTKYAALYFPRIQVRDPFTSKTIGLGPSGHMAGLYARVDVERGVHKAPANEVIRGIDTSNGFHGLEIEVTKREQDQLNPKGINALRFFPNRNTRVWGARTLAVDGSWKYINVRRIFIFVERSIDEGTQWVVFEPNDEKTWARVRQTITNFLTTVWRSGALFGTKQEEAFFVRCDRTTMTQDDIDNGRLICVIGIAPVKPAEFVIFRIQQKLIDQKEP
jgi:uncharacterized protein